MTILGLEIINRRQGNWERNALNLMVYGTYNFTNPNNMLNSELFTV